jgi:hydrogenase large subunit
MNDDVFDFFYEALPGYEEVGNRRIILGCWSAFQNPDICDYTYRNMAEWGRAYVTPGIVVDGEQITTSLVDINLGIRILLGSSYYEDWQNEETFVTHDPLATRWTSGTRGTRPRSRSPRSVTWRAATSWVMSPRWYDQRTGDHLAMDTGGGPLARLWNTALAGLVDTGYVKATGNSVQINLPKSDALPEMQFEWNVPQWSNTIERDRARIYFLAYSAAMAFYFLDKALELVRAGGPDLPGVRGAR